MGWKLSQQERPSGKHKIVPTSSQASCGMEEIDDGCTQRWRICWVHNSSKLTSSEAKWITTYDGGHPHRECWAAWAALILSQVARSARKFTSPWGDHSQWWTCAGGWKPPRFQEGVTSSWPVFSSHCVAIPPFCKGAFLPPGWERGESDTH